MAISELRDYVIFLHDLPSYVKPGLVVTFFVLRLLENSFLVAMPQSTQVLKFKPEIHRRALHTLVARGNHFKQAGGASTTVVVFKGLFVLLGIILVILTVIVLVRRSGNRGPYFWLLPAAFLFTLFNVLDIPQWIIWYDDDLNFKIFNNITAATTLFYWWTTVFLFAASLFVLRNRRNAAMAVSGARPGALEIVKLLVDLILLFAFGVLAFARSVYRAVVNNGQYYSDVEYENKISSFYRMGYGIIVITFLLVLDLAISAVNVRSLVARLDLPSKTVLAAVLPMFILHWMYQAGIIIFNAILWHRGLVISKRADDALSLLSTLEPGLIMGGIMIALLIVGLKPAVWGKPIGRHTVYNAQPAIQNAYSQQPQHFQQQMYQPQQVVRYQQQQVHAQPRVVYAPTSPQQLVAPSLPQV